MISLTRRATSGRRSAHFLGRKMALQRTMAAMGEKLLRPTRVGLPASARITRYATTARRRRIGANISGTLRASGGGSKSGRAGGSRKEKVESRRRRKRKGGEVAGD